MVLHPIISTIIRTGIRKGARYIYTGLRTQDKIIDYTYRRTGLYNRGAVRGIKHGLIAGQVIGGGLQLGLNAPDTPGNDDAIQTPIPKQRNPSRPAYKTRSGRTVRYSSRCPKRTYYSTVSR